MMMRTGSIINIRCAKTMCALCVLVYMGLTILQHWTPYAAHKPLAEAAAHSANHTRTQWDEKARKRTTFNLPFQRKTNSAIRREGKSKLKVDDSILTACDVISRPLRHQITYRNGVWQYLKNDYKHIYILKAYYDNRYGMHSIRFFVSITVPIKYAADMATGDVYALLWYPDHVYPFSALVEKLDRDTTAFWRFEGAQVGFLHCVVRLPRRRAVPTHISLSTTRCSNHSLTTYVTVIKPTQPKTPSKKIGACVKSIFGNFTRANATYLVSWLESMHYFGIAKAHISYDALTMDDVISSIFQYYEKIGFITFERIPHNLYETSSPRVDSWVSQSVVETISNNCFYRQLHSYDYTLHLDYDEIFVPRYKTTYPKLISDHLEKNPGHEKACSICSRSAFFYLYYPPASPNQPSYLPIFQYTFRQPTEIPRVTWRAGVGVRKCFQSNQYSRYMFIHNSYVLEESGGTPLVYLDPDTQVLIHHYRTKCKLYERCATEENRRFIDETLLNLFGDELKPRIKSVLEKVGYF